MPRVVGIDPGTGSLDLCGLAGGQVFLEVSIPSHVVAENLPAVIQILEKAGPVDLIAGPSGYGLPMVKGADLREQDIWMAALVRPQGQGGRAGIPGFRSLIRAIARLPWPVVFLPGVIHLPTVPPHRKVNRVDLGTADKVCVAALAIWDWCRRTGRPPDQARLVVVEVGSAFTAVLAVDNGAIVDGYGGSSGPPGFQSGGALDAEVAAWIGHIGKDTVFSGGAAHVAGQTDPDWEAFLAGLQAGVPRHRLAWEWWLEGIEKAVAALCTRVPSPRQVVLSGRLGLHPAMQAALAQRLAVYGEVVALRGRSRVKAAAEGAAILASGLAGGPERDLVRTLQIDRASGTVLDHVFYPTPRPWETDPDSGRSGP